MHGRQEAGEEKIATCYAPFLPRSTSAVMADVTEWRNRPPDKGYAILYLDALLVNAKQGGKGCIKSVCELLFTCGFGANFECKKDVVD